MTISEHTWRHWMKRFASGTVGPAAPRALRSHVRLHTQALRRPDLWDVLDREEQNAFMHNLAWSLRRISTSEDLGPEARGAFFEALEAHLLRTYQNVDEDDWAFKLFWDTALPITGLSRHEHEELFGPLWSAIRERGSPECVESLELGLRRLESREP